jgi:hypothetical protein
VQINKVEGGLKMKKSLLILLLAMLSFFMFTGISQAGQCIYLGSVEHDVYYYDSSSVEYAGDIVSFVNYDNDACEDDYLTIYDEIDCARRMYRSKFYGENWSEWQSTISPGSPIDVARQKLCR